MQICIVVDTTIIVKVIEAFSCAVCSFDIHHVQEKKEPYSIFHLSSIHMFILYDFWSEIFLSYTTVFKRLTTPNCVNNLPCEIQPCKTMAEHCWC